MFQTLARVMLSDAFTLKIRCESCGHSTEFHRVMAFTYFGRDATPADVRRRAKCTTCGTRSHVNVWI